jgi:hypothetical protein
MLQSLPIESRDSIIATAAIAVRIIGVADSDFEKVREGIGCRLRFLKIEGGDFDFMK